MPPLSGWSGSRKVTGDGSAIVGGPHTGLLLPIHISADSEIRAGMLSNGYDIRVTSTDNATTYPYVRQANGHVLTPDGVWSGYSGPQAIYSSTYDKTWVASHGASGYGKIVEINHATNAITAFGSLGNSTTPPKDDHNNAGLVLTSTGKVLALYTGHTDTVLRCRVSATAGSCSSMVKPSDGTAGEDTIDPVPTASQYSYSVAVRLSSEGTIGRIYWFYRYQVTNNYWGYVTSDDDGVTWSAHNDLWLSASTRTGYMTISSNGVNRIDFLATPGHPNEGNYLLGHFYYDGTFRNSGGTALGGTAPYEAADISTIWDGTAGTDRVWMWSPPVYDGTRPHAAFVVYPNNDATDIRYYYGRWDGSAWDTTDVTGAHTGDGLYAAEGFYPGGNCLDPDDPTSMFLCQRVSGIHELQRWTTADNGATWSKAEDLTTGSAAHVFRPFTTKGSTGKRARTFVCGNGEYTTYIDYHTVIRPFPVLDHESAYIWVLVDGLQNGTDPEFLIHFGKSDATDGQDITTTLAAYSVFAFGVVQPKQVNSNIAIKGTLNVQDRCTGELWLEAPGAYGQRINLEHSSAGNRATGTAIDMAGWSGVTVEGWFLCDTSVSAVAQVLVDVWTGASNAGVLWRRTSSALTTQAYVALEANTQVGGTMTGASMADDTPFYGVVSGRNSSGWSHWVRINTTQSDPQTGGSANFDATAGTAILGLGGNGASAGTTYLRGAFADFGIHSNTFRSKDFTDTKYAFADGETEWTFSADSSEYTATAALTSPASTISSSVTFTAPSYTAAAALVGAASTLSASGTVSLNLSSATIGTDGDSISLVFNEAVTGSTGFTLDASGGAVTMTYASGSGTDTLVFNLSRTIQAGETVTLDYA